MDQFESRKVPISKLKSTFSIYRQIFREISLTHHQHRIIQQKLVCLPIWSISSLGDSFK